MTHPDSLEKAKILFEIAQTEYRHEIERHKVASDRAAKMVSFTGLLFTIFSFLVVRVMLAPGAAGGFPWAEWAAYIVSAALVVLIMWAMLSLMNAIRRDIQSEGGITAAQFRPFDEDGYSAADAIAQAAPPTGRPLTQAASTPPRWRASCAAPTASSGCRSSCSASLPSCSFCSPESRRIHENHHSRRDRPHRLLPRPVTGQGRGHDITAVSRGTRRPYTTDSAWERIHWLTLDREKDRDFASKIAAQHADVVIDPISYKPDGAVCN